MVVASAARPCGWACSGESARATTAVLPSGVVRLFTTLKAIGGGLMMAVGWLALTVAVLAGPVAARLLLTANEEPTAPGATKLMVLLTELAAVVMSGVGMGNVMVVGPGPAMVTGKPPLSE